MNRLVKVLVVTFLATYAAGHSQMTKPQSTAPMTCRLGGEPQFGVETCEGPCDLRAIEGGYANFDSPENPAAVYSRGQVVTVKYARNNHAPGGFNRLTIVEPHKMMDKVEHEKNAFHYSCWGANSVKATPNELEKMQYGFSFIGSDGQQHDLAPGYYTTEVRIPPCVPDGNYVLGWVWFGGTGGGEVENNGPASKEPAPWGYFSDYWSCSFVKIEGGEPLASECPPIFDNDMAQFSSEGCMSANDAPGVCSYEPCKVTGMYQKPRPFQNGKVPKPLTPENFGGSGGRFPPGTKTKPPPTAAAPTTSEGMETLLVKKRSCRCLTVDSRCWPKLAAGADDYCNERVSASDQPSACKEACCAYCNEFPRNRRLCGNDIVKDICGL